MTSEHGSTSTVLIDTYRPVLMHIAQAWLASDALVFAVLQGDQVVFAVPETDVPQQPSLRHTIPANRQDELALVVEIEPTEEYRQRLRADAYTLSRMFSLEGELSDMTEELITQQDQLLALYELNHSLQSCFKLNPSLSILLDVAQRLTRVDGAVAMLQAKQQLITEYVGSVPLDFLQLIFETHQKNQQRWQSMLPDGTYVLGLPMQIRNHPVGMVALLRKAEFSSPKIKLAEAVVNQGQLHVDNVLLHEEQIAQTRLQTEIELARSVQTRLQPRKPAAEPGFDLFGASIAARHVGGDFYDFVAKPESSHLLVLGDVSGKGLSAALVMTMTRTAIRSALTIPPRSPAEIIKHVNEKLYDDFTEIGVFTTTFIARYWSKTGEVVYANAGHSPVVYCPPDENARMIEADDTALGVLPFSSCEDHTLTMPVGAILVIATDGFVEAENHDGDMYGYQRFMKHIEAHRTATAEELTQSLFNAVAMFRGDMEQSDDQTIIILKRTE